MKKINRIELPGKAQEDECLLHIIMATAEMSFLSFWLHNQQPENKAFSPIQQTKTRWNLSLEGAYFENFVSAHSIDSAWLDFVSVTHHASDTLSTMLIN